MDFPNLILFATISGGLLVAGGLAGYAVAMRLYMARVSREPKERLFLLHYVAISYGTNLSTVLRTFELVKLPRGDEFEMGDNAVLAFLNQIQDDVRETGIG